MKKLPYGFKQKRKQKHPRNTLFSYVSPKKRHGISNSNKLMKANHNYSYKDFSYSESVNANFHNGIFWGTKFKKSKYTRCNFSGAVFTAVTFENCTFKYSNFKGATFENCMFKNCKFKHTNFSYAKATNTFSINSGKQTEIFTPFPADIPNDDLNNLKKVIPSSFSFNFKTEDLIRLRQVFSNEEILSGVNYIEHKKINVTDVSYLFKFIPMIIKYKK